MRKKSKMVLGVYPRKMFQPENMAFYGAVGGATTGVGGAIFGAMGGYIVGQQMKKSNIKKRHAGADHMYKYKKCSKCHKYNGTSYKMCSSCRKKAR